MASLRTHFLADARIVRFFRISENQIFVKNDPEGSGSIANLEGQQIKHRTNAQVSTKKEPE
jgi:hypothetical protein